MTQDVRVRLAVDGASASVQQVDAVNRAFGRFDQAASNASRTASEYYRSMSGAFGSLGNMAAPIDKAAASVQRSARETANAMRMLPAQMTDIVTGLATGQSPFMVLMQQGGQLKDIFGGIRPALTAVASQVVALVNPFTLAATAAGTLLLAWQQGKAEADAYNRALIMSGNAAGTNAGALSDMARAISAVTGTQGKAAEVLATMAGTGRVVAADLERFTKAAIQMERAGGPAADETVKAFDALGRDPVTASKSFNESMNYLTASMYRQIKALQEQGNTAAAARVAQEAYFEATSSRAPQLEQQLGSLQKAWRIVSESAAKAWNAMLNVGRDKSLKEQLADVDKKLAELEQSRTVGRNAGKRQSTFDAEAAALRAARDTLQEQIRMQSAADAKAADVADANRKGIEAEDRARQLAEANASLALANAKANSQARTSLVEDEQARLQAMHSAGLISMAEFEQQRSAIERHSLINRAREIADEIAIERGRDVGQSPAALKQQQAKLVEMKAQLDKVRADLARLPIAEQAGDDARAIEEARALATQYASLWMQAHQQTQAYADQNARAMASLITDPLARARAEAEISAQAIERQAGNITRDLQNNIDMLRGMAAAAEEAGQGAQAASLRDMAGSQQTQLNGIKSSASDAADNIRLQPGRDLANRLINESLNPGAQIADGFDRASQSMSAFVRGFASLAQLQRDFAQAKAAEGLTDEQRAQLAAAETMRQANAYGTLAGAAKGFFDRGSAGYKVLSTAEKAFRTYELAMAIKNSAVKMGLISEETIAKVGSTILQSIAVMTGQAVETGAVVAGENARNTAKVPGVFMSFMSALGPWGMAAAAAAIAAVLGNSNKGGGVAFAAPNTGTGTVLGDSGAQSKSLGNSIEQLKSVDTMTMRYSAQMLSALQSIEANIGALATLIAQSGGVSMATNGVNLGSSITVGERTAAIIARSWERNFTITPYLRGLMGNLNNALGRGISNGFGSSTSVVAQGITGAPQTLGSIAQSGFAAQYFADIEEKHKLFWATVSTTTSTQLADADAEVKRNLTLILSGFAGAVASAAVPLGASLDQVKASLSSFVVDIGKISDLSSANLSAVFSAIGDKIATAALGGFEAFQHVGEGYLETVTRVASGTEQASLALQRLGVGMVSLQDLANKQGDVATELVRQSIVNAETTLQATVRTVASGMVSIPAAIVPTLSGIGDIISTLSGSASDIADTYQALTDVRLSLQLLGLSGSAVSRAMLQGAGSLSALSDGIQSYTEGFFTAQEQLAIKTGKLRHQFEALGVAMPSTRTGFRALLEGIDTSTEAGQRLLGSLLPLASAFADITDAAQQAGQGIADEIARLRGLSASTTAASTYAQLQAQFATVNAQARAGDANAVNQLPTVSKNLSDMMASMAVNRIDLARQQAALANSLQATLDLVRGGGAGGSAVTSTVIDTATTSATSVGNGNSQSQADMLTELRALRQAVESMQQGQTSMSGGLTARMDRVVRVLEGVSPDGDALRMRIAS